MSRIKKLFTGKKKSEKKQRSSRFYDDPQLGKPETSYESTTTAAAIDDGEGATALRQSEALKSGPVHSHDEKGIGKYHISRSSVDNNGDTVSTTKGYMNIHQMHVGGKTSPETASEPTSQRATLLPENEIKHIEKASQETVVEQTSERLLSLPETKSKLTVYEKTSRKSASFPEHEIKKHLERASPETVKPLSKTVIKHTEKHPPELNRQHYNRLKRYDKTVAEHLNDIVSEEVSMYEASEEDSGVYFSGNKGTVVEHDYTLIPDLSEGNALHSKLPREKMHRYKPSSKSLLQAKVKLKPLSEAGDMPEGEPSDRQHIEQVLQDHLQQKLLHQAMRSSDENPQKSGDINIAAQSVEELLKKMETTGLRNSWTNDEITQLRQRFIFMSTLEKREYYTCGDEFLISQQMPSWQDTGQTTDVPVVNVKFETTVELNEKVGLWYGDITRLELDAIVNSTPSLLMEARQGMNAVVCKKAGPLIDIELTAVWQVFAGEIAITAGYYLPAKFLACLHEVQKSLWHTPGIVGVHKLNVGAFPCISTGAKELEESESAKVALETTRQWLQENHSHFLKYAAGGIRVRQTQFLFFLIFKLPTGKKRNLVGQLAPILFQVDKIVFCVFDERNWQAYQEVMPTIFPVRASSAQKSATLPTEILRMDSQSIQLYKKALSEGEVFVHSIRVMVVGHYGVGKTTLTRRLLEEDVDLSARDSTNGIDVHVRRCRVSLADQSWTVLNKDEKVNTVFKKLAEVLSQQSSNEDASLVKEAGLDDVDGNCNNSTSVVETNTELKEVAHSQFQAAATDEPNYASEGEMSVDTNDSIGGGDVEMTSSENENAILKDLKELISNTGASDDSDYADLSIWDFAGQYVFYSTHQMFLSSRAIYLLVTDISKHIDDIVGDDECYFDSKGAESYKISGFVNFWLNSIHGYCPSDKKGVPPVILVGTHADKLDKSTKEQQENRYFEAVRNIFNESVSAMHVVDKDFSIDNAIIDPNLDALKKKIYEVASQQENWGERIPVNWLTLEHALGELCNQGLKIITREKLQDVNDAMPVPIASAEYLDLFLRFQHESANILYFDDPGLHGHVVLDPQWLVDCLKLLITAKMFCSKRPAILNQWKELSHDGILRPSLIEAVWRQDENQSFWDHRGHLIPLMEKLNIIAQCDSDSDTQHHLVPCMLKEPPTPVCMKSDCVSTPVLCITTADGFLPAGIFQRLIAACIARWPIAKQGKTNLIYCGYGCFDVDAIHRMMLYFRKCVIQLWVSNYSGKDPHPATNVCMEVRVFVLQALQRIIACLSLAQLSDLELSIKCPSKDLDDVDTRFSIKTLLRQQHEGNEVICHDHDNSHPLICSQLLSYWYGDDLVHIHDDQATSVLSPYALEKVPTEIQISQIARNIGKEYEQLGLELGLPQVKIDQIKLNNQQHVVNQTVQILLSWRRDNTSRATFRGLERAMMAVCIDTAKALACIK